MGVPAAHAAPALTVTPLTWNVLGLDSNGPTTGPNLYPVGARVCNKGSSTATGVVARLVLASGSSYITPTGPTSLSKGSLAPGACADAYFAVTVTRTKAAYDATRGVRIVASATGVPAVSTPSRQAVTGSSPPGRTPAQVATTSRQAATARAAAAIGPRAGGTLPYTGAPLDALLRWGVSGVAVGLVLLALGYRRRTTD